MIWYSWTAKSKKLFLCDKWQRGSVTEPVIQCSRLFRITRRQVSSFKRPAEPLMYQTLFRLKFKVSSQIPSELSSSGLLKLKIQFVFGCTSMPRILVSCSTGRTREVSAGAEGSPVQNKLPCLLLISFWSPLVSACGSCVFASATAL